MSTANVLDKLVETVMMQMFNKECPPTCHNRTCNSKIYQKPRKRKKRRRHCKKKRSKCPAEGVASIVCVTKCMKKCQRTPKTKCSDPCRPITKSRCVRITCCSSRASDCSDSEPKYCSKCGQPLSSSSAGGTMLSQKESPNVPRFNQQIRSNMHVLTSPEETCCPARTTCMPCQSGPSVQSHKTMVGCVPQFGPPYFLRNVEEHEDPCGNTFGIGLKGVEKHKECMMQVTCCESRTVNTSSEDFNSNCLSPDNEMRRNCPTTVHIRKCGKNIVTVRCGVESDFDLRSITSDDVGGTFNKEQIGGKSSMKQSQKAQCSQRFIHITEDQRSDNEGNRITKVRCADYSSITDESPKSKNTECAPIKPDRAQRIRNLGYGPCSDRVSRAALPIKSNLNIGYGPCCDRKTSALHIKSSRGCNEQSHMVRMRFIKPCDNIVDLQITI
uniref:Ribosomal RNA large subunit methyltransferase M n=1 Tax=Lygus hesperus TaxID=30085 RepID=A0A0A9YBA3_LYGHE